MAYLEELLPELRKGAKIRKNFWDERFYVYFYRGVARNQDGGSFRFYGDDLTCDCWELYQEPIDWDFIIKNKCLCWFWDGDEDLKCLGLLIRFPEKKDQFQYKTNIHKGVKYFKYCRPVRKDEVTFYEDKKDVL